MFPAGVEPVILASERPQTHALDGSATAIGKFDNHFDKFRYIFYFSPYPFE
jgi:hypothetical protein